VEEEPAVRNAKTARECPHVLLRRVRVAPQ